MSKYHVIMSKRVIMLKRHVIMSIVHYDDVDCLHTIGDECITATYVEI